MGWRLGIQTRINARSKRVVLSRLFAWICRSEVLGGAAIRAPIWSRDGFYENSASVSMVELSPNSP